MQMQQWLHHFMAKEKMRQMQTECDTEERDPKNPDPKKRDPKNPDPKKKDPNPDPKTDHLIESLNDDAAKCPTPHATLFGIILRIHFLKHCARPLIKVIQVRVVHGVCFKSFRVHVVKHFLQSVACLAFNFFN
jgi:hypothetical protein